MKYYQVFKERPYQPQKKPIIPAIIAGAAALTAAGIGAASNSYANSSNKALAREQMRWQSEENEKARQYNTEMWNLQNQYNTPANQRRLYEEGGYNPYLLGKENLGSGAGSAGTPATSSNPPTAPHMISPFGNGEGIATAGSQVANFMRLANESKQVQANLELQKIEGIRQLMDVEMQVYKVSGQKGVDQLRKNFGPIFKSLNYEGSFYEREMKKRFRAMDIENERNDLRMQLEQRWSPQEAERKMHLLQEQVNKVCAEIVNLESSSKLNYAKIEELASEFVRNLSAANLMDKQALQITSLLPYLENSMLFSLGEAGMSYLENYAEFDSNEKVRSLLHSKSGKFMRVASYASSPKINPVTAFIQNVFGKISDGMMTKGFVNRSWERSMTDSESQMFFNP